MSASRRSMSASALILVTGGCNAPVPVSGHSHQARSCHCPPRYLYCVTGPIPSTPASASSSCRVGASPPIPVTLTLGVPDANFLPAELLSDPIHLGGTSRRRGPSLPGARYSELSASVRLGSPKTLSNDREASPGGVQLKPGCGTVCRAASFRSAAARVQRCMLGPLNHAPIQPWRAAAAEPSLRSSYAIRRPDTDARNALRHSSPRHAARPCAALVA